MGDKRRFDSFGTLIEENFPNLKNIPIADVAGGKGYLQVALKQRGFREVVTFDNRQKHIRRFNGLNGRQGIQYYHKWFTVDSIHQFGFVVGMHPDEGTDHLIMYAVNHSIPFVVCPCCVKPSASQMGHMQYNWINWWNHLKNLAEKTHVLEELRLKINGRNMVLIGRPNIF